MRMVLVLALLSTTAIAAQESPFLPAPGAGGPQVHRTTYIPAPEGPAVPPGPQMWSPEQSPGIVDGPAVTQVTRTIGLLDHLVLFAGIDLAQGPEDLGINDHVGTRLGFNWGIPLIERWNLGLQFGFGQNFHNNTQRTLGDIDGTTQRFQTWFTLGLFQRLDRGLNWSVAYDFRLDDYYSHLTTGQVRGLVSIDLSPDDEVGFFGSLRTQSDRVRFQGFDLEIRPINTVAFFWRHVWPHQAVTRVWAGIGDSHGRFTLNVPATTPTNTPFLFGADLYVPLNDWVAVWGEANFLTPNDSGTVTAFVGIAITPGGAQRLARSTFTPMLPTANNTNFLLDVR